VVAGLANGRRAVTGTLRGVNQTMLKIRFLDDALFLQIMLLEGSLVLDQNLILIGQ